MRQRADRDDGQFEDERVPCCPGISCPGPGTAAPREAGDALVLELPVVPVRPLSHYAIGGLS